MQLKDVNESLDHRISGGSDYGWQCYGANARFLDYESVYATGSCVFDTLTQGIYEVHVEFVNLEKRPYRWLNPNTKDVMYAEAAYREIDADQAWDDIKWIDLETEEDFLEKASAIFKGETFDDRVSVPLNLNDEELFAMMKLAHEKDITLNQLMVEILQAAIDSNKNAVDE
jgi:hypothetical protein